VRERVNGPRAIFSQLTSLEESLREVSNQVDEHPSSIVRCGPGDEATFRARGYINGVSASSEMRSRSRMVHFVKVVVVPKEYL
jgi:hypothetical protein